MSNKNLKWPVVDYTGKKVGETVLPGDLFDVEINEYSVQRAVRVDLANRRVDTAHTLDRSVVHGSNRKPFRQKGTGRARAGTTNSPIWRHGGVVHGPDGNQNHNLSMNKAEHYLAFASALTAKVQSKDLVVLTKEAFTSSKTKDFKAALKALKLNDKKSLFVLADEDVNLELASQNLQDVFVTDTTNLSVYDILNANKLVLVEGTIPEPIDEAKEA